MTLETRRKLEKSLRRNGYVMTDDAVYYNDSTRRKSHLEIMCKAEGIMVEYSQGIDAAAIINAQIKEQMRRQRIEEERRKLAAMNRAQLIAKLTAKLKHASRTKVVGKLLRTVPITEYEQAFIEYVSVAWA
jgi:hypothetical protein